MASIRPSRIVHSFHFCALEGVPAILTFVALFVGASIAYFVFLETGHGTPVERAHPGYAIGGGAGFFFLAGAYLFARAVARARRGDED